MPPATEPVSSISPSPETATSGYVICPACDWRETAGSCECGSCGTSLAGVAVHREQARRGPGKLVATPRTDFTLVTDKGAGTFPLWKRLTFLGLGSMAALWLVTGHPVRYPAGMLVGSVPLQAATTEPPWTLQDGTRIIPMASYELTARLLHRERYRWDALADLAPVDYGVGWHRMSDQSVIDTYDFSNNGRRLIFTCANAGEEGLNTSSLCNMHMLPANNAVRDQLLDLKVGEMFFARGFLVCVQRPRMNPWKSSLSRDDTGDGACEIMWIKEFRRVKPPGVKEL